MFGILFELQSINKYYKMENLLPLFGVCILILLLVFIVLNKILWSWYLDLNEFKKMQLHSLNESKKQTELLKMLCNNKNIDLSTIEEIEKILPKKTGNIFIKTID